MPGPCVPNLFVVVRMGVRAGVDETGNVREALLEPEGLTILDLELCVKGTIQHNLSKVLYDSTLQALNWTWSGRGRPLFLLVVVNEFPRLRFCWKRVGGEVRYLR